MGNERFGDSVVTLGTIVAIGVTHRAKKAGRAYVFRA
jgi:hypothetical protein